MNQPTLERVIRQVQEFAVYSADSPDKPYNIRYDGKFFCSADTKDLVLQIMKTCHPRASIKGY